MRYVEDGGGGGGGHDNSSCQRKEKVRNRLKESTLSFLMKIAIDHLKSCQKRTWMTLLTFRIESLGELSCKTVTAVVPLNF